VLKASPKERRESRACEEDFGGGDAHCDAGLDPEYVGEAEGLRSISLVTPPRVDSSPASVLILGPVGKERCPAVPLGWG
jgi:hypothetical protein